MAAAIVSIGTELMRGEIVNTNASWLAERLTELGLDVSSIEVVADDSVRIQECLGRLSKQHDLIVCTGGLGPTTDDITSACVADLVHAPLELDAGSLAVIEERFRRLGRTMNESNRKQALFPKGATVIENPTGTAPGFWIEHGSARIACFPGVPRELRPMFDAAIPPLAESLVSDAPVQRKLKLFGLPESEVNERLAGIEKQFGVTLGYRAHFPEIEVKVLARAERRDQAEQLAERALDEVAARLGSAVYARGDVHFVQSVAQLLRERGMTLALAESCTAGLVSELITRFSASDYFLGGFVTYANAAKTALLGVDAQILAEHGAVSEAVAIQMAQGARERLGASIALSITGIAGPSGGSAEKPVGLVHFAVATKDGVSNQHIVFPRSRDQIRLFAAYVGLSLVRRVILSGHDATVD